MIQAKIDSSIDSALDMGAAEDFDGIPPISLANTFGLSANVQNNFDNVANKLSGMANG